MSIYSQGRAFRPANVHPRGARKNNSPERGEDTIPGPNHVTRERRETSLPMLPLTRKWERIPFQVPNHSPVGARNKSPNAIIHPQEARIINTGHYCFGDQVSRRSPRRKYFLMPQASKILNPPPPRARHNVLTRSLKSAIPQCTKQITARRPPDAEAAVSMPRGAFDKSKPQPIIIKNNLCMKIDVYIYTYYYFYCYYM